jgi:hypothetical protein
MSFDIQNTLRNFLLENKTNKKEIVEIPKRERPLKRTQVDWLDMVKVSRKKAKVDYLNRKGQ